MVLHSVTKFINGHADVVGAILAAKDPAIYQRLRKTMVNSGCNMDPHQAFLVLRGLKTLGIRIEPAQSNAMQIARWLEQLPEIGRVRYIGLKSHPQHELAASQMSGFGSMISSIQLLFQDGDDLGSSSHQRCRLSPPKLASFTPNARF